MPEIGNTLEYADLKRILPQAYPFLMLDRVVDYKKNEYLTAVKNITVNEWPVTGCNENISTFPEVLLIEAAAQAALVFCNIDKTEQESQSVQYYIGRTKAEFFSSVFIGDQIRISILTGKIMNQSGYVSGCVFVEEQKIAEIDLFLSILRKNEAKNA